MIPCIRDLSDPSQLSLGEQFLGPCCFFDELLTE